MTSSNSHLLVHKDMESITLNENIDIILTPQFYTFLHETLSLKFSYQAKKIAPSLFDGYLDHTIEHHYHAYKHDEKWYFFAYNLTEITQFLETKGVPTHYIRKVYFAQELAPLLTKPVKLSDSTALQTINDVTTIIPMRLMEIEDLQSISTLKDVKLEHGLTLSSSFNSVVPFKYAAMIGILSIMLGISYIIEGDRIKSSVESILIEQQELLANNPKLGSSMIRNSELKKYEPIDKRERLKRDLATEISKMLSRQSHLQTLIINDQKVVATIKASNSTIAKKIEDRAKAKKFKVNIDAGTEVTLEKSI